MRDGRVREKRRSNDRIVKAHKSSYGDIRWALEMLVLPAPNGHFNLLACYGDKNKPRKIFSSETNTWTETDWMTTSAEYSDTAFFDPATQSVYYHADKKTT